MQGFVAGDAAKVPLAAGDTPGFVSNIDEDVVAAVEGAEGEAATYG